MAFVWRGHQEKCSFCLYRMKSVTQISWSNNVAVLFVYFHLDWLLFEKNDRVEVRYCIAHCDEKRETIPQAVWIPSDFSPFSRYVVRKSNGISKLCYCYYDDNFDVKNGARSNFAKISCENIHNYKLADGGMVA